MASGVSDSQTIRCCVFSLVFRFHEHMEQVKFGRLQFNGGRRGRVCKGLTILKALGGQVRTGGIAQWS